jgi:hypothetical protein
MNEKFNQLIKSLEPSYQRLMRMMSVTVPTLPAEVPRAGIYLLSEGEHHLYVWTSPGSVDTNLQAIEARCGVHIELVLHRN